MAYHHGQQTSENQLKHTWQIGWLQVQHCGGGEWIANAGVLTPKRELQIHHPLRHCHPAQVHADVIRVGLAAAEPGFDDGLPPAFPLEMWHHLPLDCLPRSSLLLLELHKHSHCGDAWLTQRILPVLQHGHLHATEHHYQLWTLHHLNTIGECCLDGTNKMQCRKTSGSSQLSQVGPHTFPYFRVRIRV